MALVKPASTSGKAAPALGGRPLPGAVVAEVVEVHAEHDGGARLGLGQRADDVHQGALAVEAAVAVVEAVGGVLHLGGLDLDPAQAPLRRQGGAVVALGAGQRRRDGGDDQARGRRPSVAWAT